ncbi:hypothetical protein [Acidovorax sp. LjRoot194]|uniref:hypothetical protein n=1 Tax=Acidovorax sp. LjRoot194 TaxID=3342280 RepID=UPI003ECCFEDA
MSDDELMALCRYQLLNPGSRFASICSYDDGFIWWPAVSWGSGFAVGMRYALQMAEDHGYHVYGVWE